MISRIAVMVIACASVVAVGFPRLKKSENSAIAVYSVTMAVAVYLGLDYAVAEDWPDLHDLIDLVFGGSVKAILRFFKA